MGSNMEGNWQLLEHLAAEKPICIQPGTPVYKRTFPFRTSTGELLIEGPVSSEERQLDQHSGQFLGLKLLRGLWVDALWGDSSGTYFPMAAPQGTEAVWCSAGHCLTDKQRQWRAGYDQRVGKATSQPAFHQVVNLSWLTQGISMDDLQEFKPSLPSSPIPAADVMPDFGFMRTSSPALQPQHIFIPCGDELHVGQPVCILGFAAKPGVDWARVFLRTQSDYDELALQYKGEHGTEPPSTWQLDTEVAFRRTSDLLDNVYFPNDLVAAPGQVAAASQRVVEHTCTSFPGMSGAPGVDITAPWKLLFVHVRADADFRRDVNYGYSVNHPLFVKAYVREVLPKLLTTPQDLVKPEMTRCLHQYLTRHRNLLEDPGVLDSVLRHSH